MDLNIQQIIPFSGAYLYYGQGKEDFFTVFGTFMFLAVFTLKLTVWCFLKFHANDLEIFIKCSCDKDN